MGDPSAMKIVICGDSFSAVNDLVTCNQKFDETYSWIHELQKLYNITCYAKSGASNLDIVNQIKRATEYDLLLVNLTHLQRLALLFSYKTAPTIKEELIVQRNLELANWVANRPRSICWTPFTGYESIKSVHTKHFERENEYFNDSLSAPLTKHHMTEEGNKMLAEWAINQIEKRYHEQP